MDKGERFFVILSHVLIWTAILMLFGFVCVIAERVRTKVIPDSVRKVKNKERFFK